MFWNILRGWFIFEKWLTWWFYVMQETKLVIYVLWRCLIGCFYFWYETNWMVLCLKSLRPRKSIIIERTLLNDFNWRCGGSSSWSGGHNDLHCNCSGFIWPEQWKYSEISGRSELSVIKLMRFLGMQTMLKSTTRNFDSTNDEYDESEVKLNVNRMLVTSR